MVNAFYKHSILIILLIAYNEIRSEKGQAIKKSLDSNNSLKYLDIKKHFNSYNSYQLIDF
ncbi:21076_t:CDS:2 [Gigaspora margarita]|uniref:21076_t:CDS:1 n=1 Tax=Gigaspora margarita TaxID=4874 RepID=A0ABM8VZY4_GIGMA|nr:21076_t:CDS:2 [Gigaspora margarita]